MNKAASLVVGVVVLVVGLSYLYTVSKAPVGEVPSAGIVTESEHHNEERGDVVEYSVSNLQFGFVGYGPGKSHDGTFKTVTASKISYDETVGLPVAGSLTIGSASVSTGIEKLDSHLCAEDFFNCAVHPEIVFTFVHAKKSADGSVLVEGDLNFNGVTKRISFPATVAGTMVTADFLLDTTPFAFKYVGIDKNVRITFSFEAVRD